MVAGVKGNTHDWDYQANLVIAHGWLESAQNGFVSYNNLMKVIADGSYNFIDPSNEQRRRPQGPVADPGQDLDLGPGLAQLPGFAQRVRPAGRRRPAGVCGGQFRYEATNDPALNPVNDAQGLGNAKTIGNRTVASAFAELGMPVTDKIEVNASGRYDHYSDFGDNFSPKIGVKFTPDEGNRDPRATILEGLPRPRASRKSATRPLQGFTDVLRF